MAGLSRSMLSTAKSSLRRLPCRRSPSLPQAPASYQQQHALRSDNAILGSQRRLPSSRLLSLRAAIVGLDSLQPFHSAISEASLVSRLSFGSHDSAPFLQDEPDGT